MTRGLHLKRQQRWYDQTCTTTPQLYFKWTCLVTVIYWWTVIYAFVSDKSNKMRNKNITSVKDIRNTIMIK